MNSSTNSVVTARPSGARVARRWPLLLLLLTAGAAVAASCAMALYLLAWRPVLPASPVAFTIAEGKGLRAAAAEMQRAGVLHHRLPLVLLGRLTGAHTRIRAGHYELTASASAWELLQTITSGDVTLSAITFVEGWTLRQWRTAMAANPELRQDTASLTDAELARALGIDPPSLEGRLFPDTYLFARGSSDRALILRALRAMDAHLDREWAARAGNLRLRTPYEALILASIIEKETGRAADRSRISGVFHNRLRIGMRLQTDPTVIYGLGDAFDGDLRRRDLLMDTPFNTYTRAGLPPTPIAMAGLDSLRAALHPEQTRALYFVARGDGTSEFSETLAEHNRAVRKYQLGQGISR
jgi:UPF0755 protein